MPEMEAIRLHAPGGPEDLVLDRIAMPEPQAGEALVEVYAAAITKDELDWPAERLPAIPSYELSGVVTAVASGVDTIEPGDAVYALTSFDHDGVAAEYAAVPAEVLAPKPRTLDHVESAAVPLAALSAWQALFDHGRLEKGQRVLITGAAGGVGHFATQLAHRRGAYVIALTSPAGGDQARGLGADEVFADGRMPTSLEPVDLVLDTAGGDLLEQAPSVIRAGGRLVTVVEEPPEIPNDAKVTAAFFIVESNVGQLAEIAAMIDAGELRPAIDSVFPLADARAAFERSLASGKKGKVVLQVRQGSHT